MQKKQKEKKKDLKVGNRKRLDYSQHNLEKRNDQVGFIPGMQVLFNTLEPIIITHYTKQYKKKNHKIILVPGDKISTCD